MTPDYHKKSKKNINKQMIITMVDEKKNQLAATLFFQPDGWVIIISNINCLQCFCMQTTITQMSFNLTLFEFFKKFLFKKNLLLKKKWLKFFKLFQILHHHHHYHQHQMFVAQGHLVCFCVQKID